MVKVLARNSRRDVHLLQCFLVRLVLQVRDEAPSVRFPAHRAGGRTLNRFAGRAATSTSMTSFLSARSSSMGVGCGRVVEWDGGACGLPAADETSGRGQALLRGRKMFVKCDRTKRLILSYLARHPFRAGAPG